MPEVVLGAMSIEPLRSGSAVTVGEFDGVHLGHRALIERAVSGAQRLGVEPIAYTFDPHPAKVLAPAVAPRMLTSLAERVRLMGLLGIARVVVEPFDHHFAQIGADDWVERYLVGRLRPKLVVVGFNFSYGKGRGGDPVHLAESGKRWGFEVEVVEPVVVETMVVSSTRVREFLLEGNVAGARLLLGRNPALTGRVVKGDERGRTIGIPTANLENEGEIVPAYGVYATWVFVDDEAVARPSVTNIGMRPTFEGTALRIESHLLDFEGDLYGKRLRVELVERLRDERRFDGVDALLRQVRTDIDAARRILIGSAPR
jgi:riboflavin kinase/FMN adenylyltransferase